MDLRKLLAGSVVALVLPSVALADDRIIGLPSVASKIASNMVLVDATTGLPASITTTSTAYAPSGATVTLSATTTSSNVSFGSATTVAASNTGSNTVFITFGTTSGVTATTTGYPVLASQTIFFSAGSNTYIAGITSTSTSTLLVTPGSGVPAITGGGTSSGGGGGAITAASGSYASGAFSSGSVASGAFASGSIAAGALAANSIATGAFAAGAIASGAVAASAYADGAIITMGLTSDTAYTGSGNASLIAISKGIYNSVSSPIPTGSNVIGKIAVAPSTPAAGTASTITTGGTAVTAVTGAVNGCYITNPTSATDQGIATAENLYVNPVTTATTTGNGTTLTLVPGQSFFCIPGQTTNVSAVAATSSHAFTVVKW